MLISLRGRETLKSVYSEEEYSIKPYIVHRALFKLSPNSLNYCYYYTSMEAG